MTSLDSAPSTITCWCLCRRSLLSKQILGDSLSHFLVLRSVCAFAVFAFCFCSLQILLFCFCSFCDSFTVKSFEKIDNTCPRLISLIQMSATSHSQPKAISCFSQLLYLWNPWWFSNNSFVCPSRVFQNMLIIKCSMTLLASLAQALSISSLKGDVFLPC